MSLQHLQGLSGVSPGISLSSGDFPKLSVWYQAKFWRKEEEEEKKKEVRQNA